MVDSIVVVGAVYIASLRVWYESRIDECAM